MREIDIFDLREIGRAIVGICNDALSLEQENAMLRAKVADFEKRQEEELRFHQNNAANIMRTLINADSLRTQRENELSGESNG